MYVIADYFGIDPKTIDLISRLHGTNIPATFLGLRAFRHTSQDDSKLEPSQSNLSDAMRDCIKNAIGNPDMMDYMKKIVDDNVSERFNRIVHSLLKHSPEKTLYGLSAGYMEALEEHRTSLISSALEAMDRVDQRDVAILELRAEIQSTPSMRERVVNGLMHNKSIFANTRVTDLVMRFNMALIPSFFQPSYDAKYVELRQIQKHIAGALAAVHGVCTEDMENDIGAAWLGVEPFPYPLGEHKKNFDNAKRDCHILYVNHTD